MSVLSNIKNLFVRKQRDNVVSYVGTQFGLYASEYNFAECVWLNICELLTDLIDEVNFEPDFNEANKLQADRFKAYRDFVYRFGKMILQKIFDNGYVVVKYVRNTNEFVIVPKEALNKRVVAGVEYIETEGDFFILKSNTYFVYHKSDKDLCGGFLRMLDDVLNGSATVSRRLGTCVIASPKTPSNAPAPIIFDEKQKKDLEDELQKGYGMLNGQNTVMVLPKEMSWQVINLAGTDVRFREKLNGAVLGITDRMKLPANQVAILEAQNNNSLSNGGELEQGDKLKYKSFKRLFEATFADMARFYGIRMKWSMDFENKTI